MTESKWPTTDPDEPTPIYDKIVKKVKPKKKEGK